MMVLYIDPGTGSMLFSILIGIIGVVVFFLRSALVKIKFVLSGGKKAKIDKNKLPIVIFSDHKRYWNVFGPVCDELEKRGQQAYYYTASPDDPALEAGKSYKNVVCEFIGEGNKAFSRLNILNAYVVLSTTPGLQVYQWKRSKTVNYYVHTLHAPASIFYRMFGVDYFDALLLSAEHQRQEIRKLEELRKLPAKDIQLVGLTYLDEMKKRLDSHPVSKNTSGKPVVILAPSWGPSGILSKYGAPFIEELIKTGYHIVVRPHPQSFSSEADMLEKLMKQFPNNESFEWNSDNDNFDVLARADIMISDFSGVIFDFLLVFDKPILYANAGFSKDLYDWWWLDEEPWTFQVLPSLGKEITDEYKGNLKDMIDECINDPKYEKARSDARKATWANIGNAAPSVCDYLINKLNELSKEESN
ncbi:MAG: CDP-glycerol glycerophosphotransferase family protein [Clostridiales bacterium]|nr:CDP-glycerol glycerophosphotransferase family protein [Clostridiales bacterium]